MTTPEPSEPIGGPATDGDLGSLLGVWGHPDDEAYLSAGLMALAVDRGDRVVCVTATRGELGFPDDDPRSLQERALVREAELAACLAVLGVTDHRWLGYPDGGCEFVDPEPAIAVLVEIIDEVRPDTVLTFGPDGGTGHPDHITTSWWTTEAVRRAAHEPRLLYSANTEDWYERFFADVDPSTIMMNDEEPPRFPRSALAVVLTCDDELIQVKHRALRSQPSQVEGLVAQVGEETYVEMLREEGFREPGPDDFAERAG